ncbi:Ribonuclease P protein subunit p29 [Vitis vinifera]|uniref:Ribonuclease P protein subunit p29 n=1 Tax=Vitis vinifera TaxID=29760 RepID=A0A438DWJ7_VITVI|nr:Ribonuclease P protein subunit p29 [Vitis vinifera]
MVLAYFVGNLAFSGHATSQDVEANGPAYSQLSQTVHENLLATNAKRSIVQFDALFGIGPWYDIFKPMHDMWKGYMMQLLKNTGKNQLVQPLLSADLHGAIILVVECKIAAFNGVSGIMIRETAETLGIITQDDKFRGNPSTGRIVPKKGSVFIFQADCWKVTLQGDKLTSRNLAL